MNNYFLIAITTINNVCILIDADAIVIAFLITIYAHGQLYYMRTSVDHHRAIVPACARPCIYTAACTPRTLVHIGTLR